MRTVDLRKSSLQNIRENAKKMKSSTLIFADCCTPGTRSPYFALISAGKFVLNYVNLDLCAVFRNVPLSQNATTCSCNFLPRSPHSFHPPPCCWGLIMLGKRGPGLSPAPTINVPSPTLVLISEATGRLLNQSPHYLSGKNSYCSTHFKAF